jgi:hypothetical protein
MPAGAYLEARFPDPGYPDNHSIVGEPAPAEGDEITLLSPDSGDFKCWNYEVVVDVYRDDSKSTLLDSHKQTIQSRIDLSRVSSNDGVFDSLLTGSNCPTGETKRPKSAEQWEAMCEREREKRIAPERAAAIERCIEQQNKNPDYCQRYFSDFGSARRVDNYIVPRLYDDLPACIEARKARREKSRR